jgi:ParB family transcriptional regulator, chromosome partitioning protein
MAKKKAVRRKKAAAKSVGLSVDQIRVTSDTKVRELSAAVEADEGAVLGAYSDPYGGTAVLLVALPIDRVEPTPYQRDASDAHVKRLMTVIEKVGRFLDPLVLVRQDEGYWTPNGNHRLQAMRKLGARTIIGLLVADPDVAFKILALNTEKAHNLREKSLEVIRIYRGLIDEDSRRPESQFAYYLEEASLVTMGLCYERNGKFAGGAYNPIVRRLEKFSEESLSKAFKEHEKHADMLMQLDERVAAVIAKLKARGFVSPYLRAFVVARINPLRWMQGEPPPLEDVLKTMRERAGKFNTEKIRQEDLASAGGAPDESD